MSHLVRVIATGGAIGTLVAGTLAAPAYIGALADEPVEQVVASVEELFGPEAIDPKQFRKYAVSFDESVSSDAERRSTVTKIAHGRMTTVSIVTTPSGTYSSDALLSPHVRYPGIEVTAKPQRGAGVTVWGMSDGAYWSVRTNGSFVYITPRFATRS